MESNQSLNCFYCTHEVISLSHNELHKLQGLSFRCECCGHINQLDGLAFLRNSINDPYSFIFEVEKFL